MAPLQALGLCWLQEPVSEGVSADVRAGVSVGGLSDHPSLACFSSIKWKGLHSHPLPRKACVSSSIGHGEGPSQGFRGEQGYRGSCYHHRSQPLLVGPVRETEAWRGAGPPPDPGDDGARIPTRTPLCSNSQGARSLTNPKAHRKGGLAHRQAGAMRAAALPSAGIS